MEKGQKFNIGDEVVRTSHVINCAIGKNRIDPMKKVERVRMVLERKGGYSYMVDYHTEHHADDLLHLEDVKSFAINYIINLLRNVTAMEDN